MKEIYILRHGKAQDITECQSQNDFDRKLTEEGIEKTKKTAKYFNKIEKPLNIILSSPYTRAKETAEIFIDNLDYKPQLEIVDFLSAGSSINEISKGLNLNYFDKDKILIVGHAPDLEIFTGKLIGAQSIKLKKGALAKVILDSSFELTGKLEWLITPKLIKS